LHGANQLLFNANANVHALSNMNGNKLVRTESNRLEKGEICRQNPFFFKGINAISVRNDGNESQQLHDRGTHN
jgi:hypothetical protein